MNSTMQQNVSDNVITPSFKSSKKSSPAISRTKKSNLEASKQKKTNLIYDEKYSKCFWLLVLDDSMLAENERYSCGVGDHIFVDPKVESLEGRFVVAGYLETGKTYFGKFVKEDGKNYLKPLNPLYPMIELIEDLIILGVVVKRIELLG